MSAISIQQNVITSESSKIEQPIVGQLGDREVADLRQKVKAIENQAKKEDLIVWTAGIVMSIAGFSLMLVGLFTGIAPLAYVGLGLMGAMFVCGAYGRRSLNPLTKTALETLDNPEFIQFMNEHKLELTPETLTPIYYCFNAKEDPAKYLAEPSKIPDFLKILNRHVSGF